VTATDWDTGDNARIRYSILGNVAALFHIDQRGVISAHVTIDRERYDSFRFPVLAIDGGSPVSRTGSALVIVSIEDINDERPRFSQPTYIFSVWENEPSGTTVEYCISQTLFSCRSLDDHSTYFYQILQMPKLDV
jgi:Cadherin domain